MGLKVGDYVYITDKPWYGRIINTFDDSHYYNTPSGKRYKTKDIVKFVVVQYSSDTGKAIDCGYCGGERQNHNKKPCPVCTHCRVESELSILDNIHLKEYCSAGLITDEN